MLCIQMMRCIWFTIKKNTHKYSIDPSLRYCISCYFREGFIFANFTSQTLAKIYSNDNIRKITKLTTRELLHLVQNRENNGLYNCILGI